MTNDWLSIKEAAALYGLNAEYFRRNYCDEGGILDRMGGLRSRKGPKGRRRILVWKGGILNLIAKEVRQLA